MKFFTNIYFNFLVNKILYFMSITVKCISCRMKGLKKKSDRITYRHKGRHTYIQTDRQAYRHSDL